MNPVTDQLKEIFARLGLCECGSEADWIVILEFLERANNFEAIHSNSGSLTCSSHPDANERFVEFVVKVLDSWNLIDHGDNISNGAWLTDDGRVLQQWLRTYGTDTSQ